MVNIIRGFSDRIQRAVILCAAFFVPKNYRPLTRKKTLYMGGSLAVLASVTGVYAASLLVHSEAAKESQTSTVEVKVSAETNSEPIVSEVPTSADTSVQLHIKSSAKSDGRSAEQGSAKTQETSRTRRIINRQSADGRSSVRFEVDAGAQTRVEMNEHGSSIEIKVEEKTGM